MCLRNTATSPPSSHHGPKWDMDLLVSASERAITSALHYYTFFLEISISLDFYHTTNTCTDAQVYKYICSHTHIYKYIYIHLHAHITFFNSGSPSWPAKEWSRTRTLVLSFLSWVFEVSFKIGFNYFMFCCFFGFSLREEHFNIAHFLCKVLLFSPSLENFTYYSKDIKLNFFKTDILPSFPH